MIVGLAGIRNLNMRFTKYFINNLPAKMFSSTTSPPLVYTELKHRCLIKASGADSSTFLQGLLTNDMECLDTRCGVPCMYSMLLNTKGRILHDLIVYHAPFGIDTTSDLYLVECDRNSSDNLKKFMNRYRLRKKVDLQVMKEDYKIWSVFPHDLEEHTEPVLVHHKTDRNVNIIADTYDPRMKGFARRLVLPANVSVGDVLENVQEADSVDRYHERRFFFGIGEGATDMPPENSLPLDSNAVFMNGVSFSKGCYIGQELTARTHHTGVVRKRLMPVLFDNPDHNCESGASIENNKGKSCGKLRDSCGKYGLAMLRIPDVIGKGPLTVKCENGDTVGLTTKIPWWWPSESDPIIKQALVGVKQ